MTALRDPRAAQICVLTTLHLSGVLRFDLDVSAVRTLVVLAATVGTQLACSRLWRLPAFDPKSALISGLSLSLLLRTDGLGIAAAAGVAAVASKFVLRWNDRHIFNPTCFAIVLAMGCSDRAWVSSGQWGSGTLLALGLVCLGLIVLTRAARSDVTLAFLAAYATLLCARSLWLGDPFEIPLHALQSGALLVFAFFMISDPKTTPDARAGRVLFACLVAAGGLFVQYALYRQNGLLWSLVVCAPLVPGINRLFAGSKYAWASPTSARHAVPGKEHLMQRSGRDSLVRAAVALALLLVSSTADAFCGFYVAKADTTLFNRASQVVLVRDGDRTVVTMSNDYRGDPAEFAMVIPVPTVLERGQIQIGDRKAIEHLDAYTAPRLVEYFDPDPCRPVMEMMSARQASPTIAGMAARREERASGVTIEASYTVGEYDILILSAEESDGLLRWLTDSGYHLPDGAESILGSYIKQGLRFFVAKVNLEAQARTGFSYLRPLRIAYESPRFMLPIRLGTLNADGPQELFVYALTRTGRVETTNYRTTRLPSDMDLPPFVKDEFGAFYTAMFDEQVRREEMRTVFLEYAWDMGWCDPCAANPLSPAELRSLGVFWESEQARSRYPGPVLIPVPPPAEVFVTRLHVRYDAEHFPADLQFQETGDRKNFQGRYVLRHPYEGEVSCKAASVYRRNLQARQDREVDELASLTGWGIATLRQKAGLELTGATQPARWWEWLQ